MRKLWRLLPLLVVLAGCGGGGHKSPNPVKRPDVGRVKAVIGQPCVPSDYAMQCALPSQPLTPQVANTLHATRSIRAAADTHLYGVDFAWGGPRSCGVWRALGVKFVIGYLSYDSGKNLGLATTQEAHRCGVATVVGWETTANRAAQGFAAGASDGREAGRQAAAIGNTHDAIWFAIDFDASGPEVYSYFKGAQSVLGSRVDAYGGYRPLGYLHAHGAVGNLNFQTYAWSGGAWLPASIAPLEQYLNGAAFDNDRAVAANYGQFPAPVTGPSQATIQRWRAERDAAFRQYSPGCKYPQQSNRCRHIGAGIETVQHQLWTVYPRWALFGKHASHLNSAIAWVVRPEANYWTHAAQASGKAYTLNGCGGIATFGTPRHTPLCRKLDQRARWFGSHASALVKAYS